MSCDATITGLLTCPPRRVMLDTGTPARLLALQTHRMIRRGGKQYPRTTIHQVLCSAFGPELNVGQEVTIEGRLETITFRYSHEKKAITGYCIIASRMEIPRNQTTKPSTPKLCAQTND